MATTSVFFRLNFQGDHPQVHGLLLLPVDLGHLLLHHRLEPRALGSVPHPEMPHWLRLLRGAALHAGKMTVLEAQDIKQLSPIVPGHFPLDQG